MFVKSAEFCWVHSDQNLQHFTLIRTRVETSCAQTPQTLPEALGRFSYKAYKTNKKTITFLLLLQMKPEPFPLIQGAVRKSKTLLHLSDVGPAVNRSRAQRSEPSHLQLWHKPTSSPCYRLYSRFYRLDVCQQTEEAQRCFDFLSFQNVDKQKN